MSRCCPRPRSWPRRGWRSSSPGPPWGSSAAARSRASRPLTLPTWPASRRHDPRPLPEHHPDRVHGLGEVDAGRPAGGAAGGGRGRQGRGGAGGGRAHSGAEVEGEAGKPIPRIFLEDGEAAFRELEERAVARLSQRLDVVIALGGGAVTSPVTRERLRDGSFTVLLDVSVQTAWRRIEAEADDRPLAGDARGFADLY